MTHAIRNQSANPSQPHLILTVDYEGDGLGFVDLDAAVIRPTEAILRIAERFSVPVTLFVDVSEFRRMETAEDVHIRTANEDVKRQLRDALARGHDLQLHLHPQWDDARLIGPRQFKVDVSRWRIANLKPEEIQTQLSDGKRWLETLSREIRPDYRCVAFRAGAWGIQPATAVLSALRETGIPIDSTVAPGTHSIHPYGEYDFRRAPSAASWMVWDDVCETTAREGTMEAPIATGRIGARRRIGRLIRDRRQGTGVPAGVEVPPSRDRVLPLERLHALTQVRRRLRLDPAIMDGRDLIAVTQEWIAQRTEEPTPIVLITHSKAFGASAERALTEFLNWTRTQNISPSTYGRWLAARGT